MKKSVCLYFQVHQPLRLKRYRFFDIGKDHYYYDEFANRNHIRKVAERCYLPANQLMLELIKQHGGAFKLSYSISGVVLEQLQQYAPEVIESFKALAKTGCVEFLGETYSHSLSVLADVKEFEAQVRKHSKTIEQLFGQKPTTFRNTELVYSDDIGERVYNLGFSTMLTEGAKHVLGWKSPNYVYANAINPKLKVLPRNFRLSDDVAFRFSNTRWSEYPLTADKYAAWVKAIDHKDEVVNLFMDYEVFGYHHRSSSGIFEFLRYWPGIMLEDGTFEFLTPAETAKKHQPVAPIKVPHPISWADEERDLTAWLGNDLQNEAFNKVYALGSQVEAAGDPSLLNDWRNLQDSDHLYYMTTKLFFDRDVRSQFSPYESPYDAFINYMNVVSDFTLRVKKGNEAPAVSPKASVSKAAGAKKTATTKAATTKKDAAPKAKAAAKSTTEAKAGTKTAPAKKTTAKPNASKETKPKKGKQ